MSGGGRLSDTSLGRALAFAGAGVALAMAELLLVLGSCWHLFLSLTEVSRFFFASLWAPLGLCLLVGMLGDAAVSGLRRLGRGGLAPLRVAVALAFGPLLSWAAWSLTEGRRLRDLPGRPWAVLAFGLGAALLLSWLAGRWAQAFSAAVDAVGRTATGKPRASRTNVTGPGTRPAVRWASLLIAVALVAQAVDALVLRRLYPALHWSLSGLALTSAPVAACLLSPLLPAYHGSPKRAALVVSGLLFAAPIGVLSLRAAPNLRFVVELSAPLNGKLLAAVPQPQAVAPSVAAETATGSRSGVDGTETGADLRGRDVLLISIDALRADRLRVHGGQGLTPALDALASNGVVFERAYTTTPHTSYAVSSLMTGKYMREVMALTAPLSGAVVGDSEQDGEGPEPGAVTTALSVASHVTLPDILRRYGYRTAAFYPPAIFFVDQHRFAGLSDRQLGFEYEKRMFADGFARVGQLADYLDGPGSGHPVFAWVHLFEPHEPYAPDPEYHRGDDPESRYDGEVAQADAAVGALVAAFRKRRPQGLVIVTADHGEEFGDHGGYHHGTTLYDEQIRVPLLWSAPGVFTPRRVAQAVDLVDVSTTVLSLLGMPRDVRMRGDDLSPLLVGPAKGEPLLAFAATEDAQMVTDGRFKLVCREGRACRLFDLLADPRERNDLSAVDPGTVARLRRELARFSGSIAEMETIAMEGGGVPAALARARLGDTGAAADLVPLLGAPRDSVRAAAAATLGRLDQRVALPVLTRLSQHDPAPAVRAQALIARVRLGDRSAHAGARTLTTTAGLDVARGAALALAHGGDGTGLDLLTDWILDPAADEAARRQALAGLAELGDARAVGPLSEVLAADVRLRPQVATALGRIGGDAAAEALLQALRVERYPEARRAEGWALTSIGDDRASTPIAEHLGRPSGMPEGLSMLVELGALDGPARKGYRLAQTPSVRVGHFLCEPGGCWPSVSAALWLPRLARFEKPRLVLQAFAEHAGASLKLAGRELALASGGQQVAVTLARTSEPVPLSADPGVLVEAVAVVPSRREIPPPPPEPWQAPNREP